MTWINHNSSLLLGFGILAVVAYFLLRDGVKVKDFILLGGLAILLILVWLPLRPQEKMPTEAGTLSTQIGAGLPVLLEIQSPY